MRYQIISMASGEVLDDDALPTAYMLADWAYERGFAVKRGKCWYATDYPGFVVEPTETPIYVRIKEIR